MRRALIAVAAVVLVAIGVAAAVVAFRPHGEPRSQHPFVSYGVALGRQQTAKAPPAVLIYASTLEIPASSLRLRSFDDRSVEGRLRSWCASLGFCRDPRAERRAELDALFGR